MNTNQLINLKAFFLHLKTAVLLILCTLFPWVAQSQNWLGTQNANSPLYRFGRVGIGTSRPLAELHILDNDGDTSAILFIQPGSWRRPGDYGEIQIGDPYHAIRVESGVGMVLSDFNAINLRTGGKNPPSRLYIDNDGKLGIGTQSPSTKMEVIGSIYTNQDSAGIIVDAEGATRFGFMKYLDHPGGLWRTANQSLEIGRVSSTRTILEGLGDAPQVDIFVAQDGKVGIATKNPNTQMEVNGSLAIGQENAGIVVDSVGKFRLGMMKYENRPGGIWRAAEQGLEIGRVTSKNTVLNGLGNSPVLDLVIDENGQVGIGTPSPQSKLEVSGALYINQEDAGLIVDSEGFSRLGLMKYNTRATGLWRTANQSLEIGRVSNDSTILEGLGETPQVDFIIDEEGKIGIGNTNPRSLLHVGLRQGDRLRLGSSEYFQDAGSNRISVNGSLIADFDGFDDLGSPIGRWKNVYITGGVIVGNNIAPENLKTMSSRPLKNVMNKVAQLRPLKIASSKRSNNLPSIALIPEEVRKVLPEVVVDFSSYQERGEEGQTLDAPQEGAGIDYVKLITYLVAGLQEQQLAIQDLENKIEQLENKQNSSLEEKLITAKLYPNQPNPFQRATTFKFDLPETVQKASLHIYDLNGQELKNIALMQRGAGSLTLEAKALTPGMYLYSLIADGQEIDTRRMIITQD